MASERKSFGISAVHGGIVENTDMSLIPSAATDAFSGATSTGLSASLHYEKRIKRNYFVTGIDVMINNQTFTYNDVANRYAGTRDIRVSQFRIPLLYQVGLFRQSIPEGVLKIRAGLSAGYTRFNISNSGFLPETVTTYPFSVGPAIGGSITPWRAANGASLSITGEMWRSFSPGFSDVYNVGEQSGMSYGKIGLIFHLPTGTF
ncbi:MAG: hypothetical protein C0593_02530 [Marinilabiliales bacterium]|nr:MAG: hypothetical protein C0593_02530 [Marinilabiliales bacterium]